MNLNRWRDYLELTKPRINFLVLVTTGVGFLLGSHPPFIFQRFIHTLLGTALTVAGSGVLNQWLERDLDAKMKRTAQRPLPAGRLHPRQALIFGIILSGIGLFYLAFMINFLTSFLGFIAGSTYLFMYTPLKTRTSLNTIVGAIPGAIPPMMGWSAATSQVNFEAWVLFSILFFWQLPHFLSLASLYKDDYAEAGFQMLPSLDLNGGMTIRQIILYTSALMAVSLLPTLKGMTGSVYFFGALFLGLGFLGMGLRCAFLFSKKDKIREAYKGLFHASIIYLPVMLILMVVDKI